MNKTIDVTQVIKSLDGEALTTETCPACGRGKAGDDLTLRAVITRALTTAYGNTRAAPTAEDARRQMEIALEVHGADKTVSLRETDIEIIKACLPLRWQPWAAGMAAQMLTAPGTGIEKAEKSEKSG